jgi:hypothetical protein
MTEAEATSSWVAAIVRGFCPNDETLRDEKSIRELSGSLPSRRETKRIQISEVGTFANPVADAHDVDRSERFPEASSNR